MQTIAISNTKPMSGPQTNSFWEYLLVVHPDAGVYAQVMAEKQFFSAKFDDQMAIKTKPQITVANFLAMEPMEDTIIRWMRRVISTKKSFTVTLDQYGAFRPHTIYLRVQDHQPFQQLASELKVVDQYIRSNGCPEMKLITNPHLTIARRLESQTYQQAVAVYADKTFHASFTVNELLLLRRQHQFDSCKQVNVFGLQP
ncbi:MAG: 2'-5' RNA ligase family protein [Sediminibacterium sp.]